MVRKRQRYGEREIERCGERERDGGWREGERKRERQLGLVFCLFGTKALQYVPVCVALHYT